MPTVYLLDPIAVRHSDPNLSPVSGAKLHTWVAGTTTNQATYTDSTGSTPLPNPVVADSTGIFPEIWITGSAYDFECRKSDDTTVLWTRPNVSSPVAALQASLIGTGGGGLVEHSISTTYPTGTLGAALTGMVNMAEVAGVDRTGVSDSTSAVAGAFAQCKRAYFPAGTYLVNALALPSNIEIYGDGDSTIIRPLSNSTAYIFNVDSGSTDPNNNVANIYIHDLQLRGWSDTAGLSQFFHLVNTAGITNARFERVTFRAARGDCIYLGGGSLGNERHNFGVTIRKCHFDGVNHSNRNGVSVVDCQGLLIDDNLFENLTDSTMPGPIDVEPNAGFSIQRDIKVTNNRFYRNGGTAGWFAIQVGNISPTTPTSGYLISGNTVDSDTYTSDIEKGLLISLYGDASSATYPLDFKASDNTFRNTRNLVRIDGASDVTFKDNRWLGSLGDGEVGLTYRCIDIDFEDNLFYQCGNDNIIGGKGLTLFNMSYCGLRRNRFVNCGKADGTAGIAINLNTGSSDNVSIEQDTVTGARTLVAVAVQVAHTLTPATNILRQNAWGTLDDSTFLAARGTATYNPPSLASGSGTSVAIPATGARVGRPAFCSFSLDQALVAFSAYVDSADSITVILTNRSAGTVDLGSGTLSVWAPPV